MRTETKKVMVYVCTPRIQRGLVKKGEEGVDTLRAAKPPYSVSNGP